jgi:uncharacterized protein
MLGELNEQQINNVLSSQVIGRLGCCDKGTPYIVPVTYTFDGNYIYGQMGPGKKLNILRAHPKVCFEVDSMLNMANWQSVILQGQFEELKGKTATTARSLLFNRIYPLTTSRTLHAHEHELGETMTLSDDTRIKPIMYRIRIVSKTGRFERD